MQLLLPPSVASRGLLFVTKESVLLRLMADDVLPRNVAMMCRYGLPTPQYLRVVQPHLSRSRSAIFVGDLDPLDIHVYLALSYNAILPSGRPRAAIHYGGINDAWLQLCQRNLKRGQRLEALMIKMDDAERKHFPILDAMIDIAAI